MSRQSLFTRFIGKYYNKSPTVINTDKISTEFVFGNGGSWLRSSVVVNTMYKIATMKKNGVVNIMWNIEEENDNKIDILSMFPKSTEKGNKIQYILIYGEKEKERAGEGAVSKHTPHTKS